MNEPGQKSSKNATDGAKAMSTSMDSALVYQVDACGHEEADFAVSLAEADDNALVARAGTGQMAAFEELVRRHRNSVYGLAFRFLHDREEAWDASQEVFIKVHRSIGRFRGTASFKTWVFRITANQCKDMLKKRRLKTVALSDVGEAAEAGRPLDEPTAKAEASELGRAIETALETLSVKHRTAFILREYEGLSYEEIAQVMGCSAGTVMSRLHHARKKLQRALVQMGVVEEETYG
jgi:RNA polymerase sigma-70 factor (ECF subfamily)